MAPSTPSRQCGDMGGDNDIAAINLHLPCPKTPALILVSVCLVLLSLGAVGALLLFVYLSFLYPHSANILLPVLLAPVIAMLWNNGHNARRGMEEQTACTPCIFFKLCPFYPKQASVNSASATASIEGICK